MTCCSHFVEKNLIWSRFAGYYWIEIRDDILFLALLGPCIMRRCFIFVVTGNVFVDGVRLLALLLIYYRFEAWLGLYRQGYVESFARRGQYSPLVTLFDVLCAMLALAKILCIDLALVGLAYCGSFLLFCVRRSRILNLHLQVREISDDVLRSCCQRVRVVEILQAKLSREAVFELFK